MASYDVTVGNLIINRMPLSTYNELSKNKGLSANQLYFIDDITEFDMKNMRVSNVSNPLSDFDAVNKQYTEDNFISKTSLSSELKDVNYSKSRIISEDLSSCVSSDCGIYQLKFQDSDWVVQVINGPYTADQIHVDFYNNTRVGGWRFNEVGKEKTEAWTTKITDKSVHKIQFINTDGSIHFIARRDCWEKKDKLVRASEVVSCISYITSSSSTAEIGQALYNLYQKLK